MTLLAHRTVGDGPRPLLLLHGFLGSGRNLAAPAGRLAERAPSLIVVIPDLTGHGASPPLPAGADLATLAADVLGTARSLGLRGPFRAIGHSLGGRVALRACLLEPAALAHVTLLDIGPAPIPPGATDTDAVLHLLAGAPDTGATRDVFRDHFRRGGLAPPVVEWLLLNLEHDGGAYRWRVDRSALAALHARTSAEDLWAAVEGRRAWGLRCIRGGRSAYVGDHQARRLAAAGCPVETLPDAGHFLHVDQPRELLDLLAGDPG